MPATVQFHTPQLLWLLALPAALLIWELGRRARATAHTHPKILAAQASAKNLRLTETAATRRTIKGTKPLLWLGLALGLVALARPQYGERETPVFEQSREVIIALDLSRSMLAEDIKPSRLDRAKLLISGLFERLAGERVGLVVFSGTAFLQSPLSSDYEILREFLPALGPDTLPEGGTNYRALLDTALDAFSDTPATDRFLIVLSDGEATDDTWERALASIKKRGIHTIALGIGSPAGAMIPDGAGGFVKDERGAVVLSRLEPATLRALAAETGGLYRDASTWLDLAALIAETVEQGRQGEFTDTHTQHLIDRYQWALAPALALLLLSVWFEFPVLPRPRSLTLQAERNNTARATTAVTALLLAALLLSHNTAPAQTADPEPATSALGKIVSRLAGKPTPPNGRDWAELARETVTWGQKLQAEQHPVPSGPVHDALRATTLGEALDSQTADWESLRSELETLLETPQQPQPEQPEDPKQPDSEQNSKGESQDSREKAQQQNQDGSQNGKDGQSEAPDSGSSGESQQDKAQPQGNDGQQNSDNSAENEGHSDAARDRDTEPENSTAPAPRSDALGDMNEDAPQPEPQNDEQQSDNAAAQKPETTPPPTKDRSAPSQQVGGTQAQSPASETDDPALAASLQKLEKIKGDDSPAQLFQMMDDAPRNESANASKKNW